VRQPAKHPPNLPTHPTRPVQVASIPIAIEIVCTTTLALGSRQLSAYGAIVTRLQAIEEMAGMNMLCSDKTGE
jgi:H+-transporting ATPase